MTHWISNGRSSASIRTVVASNSERRLFSIGGPDDIDRARVSVPGVPGDLTVRRLVADPSGRTVQAIAAAYLRSLLAAQPSGPYYLCGWSECGVIAYELAYQLLGRDESVDFVGLIDTMCPLQPAAGQAANAGLTVQRYDAPSAPLAVCVIRSEATENSPEAGRLGWDELLGPARVAVISPARPRAAGEGDAAAWLRDALARAPLAAHGGPWSASDPRTRAAPPSVATLQSGKWRDVPVFCVPGAGASIVDFLPLAHALSASFPVHAFQARGIDERLVPHSSVEAAAACYLRELHAIHSRGEVTLVGHSFGGWIACEMALRLEEQGRAVRLIVLDSRQPGQPLAHDCTRAEALMMLVALWEQAVERSLDVSLEQLQACDPDAQLELLHRRLVALGVLPARSRASALRGAIRSFEANVRTTYEPRQTLRGSMRLILARGKREAPETAMHRMNALVAGWRQVAPRLEFQLGPGNHVTLLKAPHVEAWADCVRPPQPTAAVAPRPGEATPRGSAGGRVHSSFVLPARRLPSS